jgi:hypothetical protein
MCESWASCAAKKLKKRDANQVPERAAMFEKARLIEQQGPHQWHEVCEHVKTMCDELNAEYGDKIVVFHIGQNNDLNVQFRHGDAISQMSAICDFSTSTGALRWSYSSPGVEAVTGGKGYFDVSNGVATLRNSTTLSCRESIARQILDGLLNVGMESKPVFRGGSSMPDVAPIFTRRPEDQFPSPAHHP